MDYRELERPEMLAPFVRAVWRLSGGASRDDRLAFDAMPDGCVELIHRFAGTSQWQGEQPEIFVAGICTGPAQLRFSGDAEFLGIRLWPWAWNRISPHRAPGFHDRWQSIARDEEAADLCKSEDHCVQRLAERFAREPVDPVGRNVPNSSATGELAALTGLSHRSIQRWFVREIGMTPRRYMRLLRFQRAVEDGGDARAGLAQEAVSLGYSDQAHMSRDFRGLSGKTARTVRARAKGPFIDG